MHRQLRMVGWVALGGLFGAPARAAIADALPTASNGFPTATFVTNLSGAFALGLLVEALARRGPDAGRLRTARLVAGTGFLGAFTTYSTLAVETDLLGRSGHVVLASLYALVSVLGGLVCAVAGIALSAGQHRRRHPALPVDPDVAEGG